MRLTHTRIVAILLFSGWVLGSTHDARGALSIASGNLHGSAGGAQQNINTLAYSGISTTPPDVAYVPNSKTQTLSVANPGFPFFVLLQGSGSHTLSYNSGQVHVQTIGSSQGSAGGPPGLFGFGGNVSMSGTATINQSVGEIYTATVSGGSPYFGTTFVLKDLSNNTVFSLSAGAPNPSLSGLLLPGQYTLTWFGGTQTIAGTGGSSTVEFNLSTTAPEPAGFFGAGAMLIIMARRTFRRRAGKSE